MIARKVSGALRSVSTAKKTRTTAVAPVATRTTAAFAPISERSRNAATPMRRKIISEHALPTDAMAERSTVFATTSTSAAVTRTPACGPSRERRPSSGGNCPDSLSIAVSPPDA